MLEPKHLSCSAHLMMNRIRVYSSRSESVCSPLRLRATIRYAHISLPRRDVREHGSESSNHPPWDLATISIFRLRHSVGCMQQRALSFSFAFSAPSLHDTRQACQIRHHDARLAAVAVMIFSSAERCSLLPSHSASLSARDFRLRGAATLGARKWFAIPAPGGPKENLFLIRTQGSFPPIRYTCVYTCIHFHMPRRGLSPYSLPLTAISEDVDVKLSFQLSPASCHEADDAAYASRTFCDVQPPPILNATVSRLPSLMIFCSIHPCLVHGNTLAFSRHFAGPLLAHL